jgi:MFS family permease
MVNLTVITLGQLMITLYDPAAFPLFALASILVSLAAVPVALTTSPPPAPLARVRLRPLRLYRLSPVGFLGCLAVGLANGPFWTLAPVFALESGLDLIGVALFMSVPVLAGAVAQWPFGRLSDSIDRRLVIAVVFLLGTAAGVALVVAGHVWPQGLLYAAGAFGAAAFPVYAVCVAHANDFAAADEFVETSSGLLLANGIGSAVGPLLASAAMQQVGPAGLFGFTAAVHLAMAAFTLYRMRRRAAVPTAEKPHFVAVPRTAPTVFELDERGPEHHAAGEAAAGTPR